MTGTVTVAAGAFLAVFAVCALVDWWAVGTHRPAVERFAKPLTTAALVGAAATVDAGVGELTRWLFVGGIVACLVGDVLLLPPRRFVPGLVAFLVAHLAFIGGLVPLRESTTWMFLGAVIAALGVAGPGRHLLLTIKSGRRASLVQPVGIYLLTIVIMMLLAWNSAIAAMAAGATLFVVSDSVLAWREFVAEKPWMRIVVTISYHSALLLLVLGLLG